MEGGVEAPLRRSRKLKTRKNRLTNPDHEGCLVSSPSLLVGSTKKELVGVCTGDICHGTLAVGLFSI